MALTITINAVDRTAFYERATLAWTEKLDLRTVCSFRLSDDTYAPVKGEEVIVTDGATTHFLGIITKIRKRLLRDATTFRYWVTCGDYSYLLQRRFVADSYDNQTLAQIVADIISDKFPNEGFTQVGVETGPTIERAVFNYIFAADAFDQLSDITGYHWYVDTDKDIHFEQRNTTTAPFDQTDASNDFLIESMEHAIDDKRYRNRQIVRAGTDVTASRVETLDANTTRVFTLIFPVAEAPTIRTDIGSGFAARTVGIRGVDTAKDWYWQKDDHQITQDDGGTILTGSHQIEVTYKGLFPLVVAARDDVEIAARVAVEGGDAFYDNIASEPEIDELDAATAIATGLLRRFGELPEYITYDTDGSGLRAGQLQTVNLTAHSLNDTYLISEISAKDLGGPTGGYVRYSVKAVTGEDVGGWERFFMNIVRGGRKFVLRENEVVHVLVSLATGNTITLTDAIADVQAAPETRAGFATVGYSEAG